MLFTLWNRVCVGKWGEQEGLLEVLKLTGLVMESCAGVYGSQTLFGLVHSAVEWPWGV